jgi:hypothetical protein
MRKITFTISGLEITATELDDGTILFELAVPEGSGADIRGLFFDINDPALIGNLQITGADVTNDGFGEVSNLGHGNNMHGSGGANKNGKGGEPYDVGMSFGTQADDDISSTSFILSSIDGEPLTLDLIANVRFGARLTSVGDQIDSAKVTVIAPAAPDAIDDSYDIFEDGQSGLDAPSHTPNGVLFAVLANDTDADGDTLTLTEVFGASHGTVEIVDGDDADLLPGDAILYTPDQDYAGPDSFTYGITDNNGGSDFAQVNVAVAAVADLPDLDVQVQAGNAVNEIRILVTATQTDADSSEFIDSIVSGSLPVGATISPVSTNPGDEPDQIVQEFLLTLPIDQDSNFDLTFTAVSAETSNGDKQNNSVTVPIVYEYNSTTTALQFSADDQSIWSSGDEFVFDDDTFFGLDTGIFDEDLTSGPFVAGIDGHVKLGFQSTLHFEGGDIDALADYDVMVETNYNKTVDVLLIDTSALLTDASFFTEGPVGSYMLDFVYDILLNAYAGVSIDFGSIDFDPLGIIPGDQTLSLGSIDETLNVSTGNIGPGSINIIDLDSDSLGGTIDFPPPADSLSLDFAWPNITTSGTDPLNPVHSMGASNNFLQLNLDVDDVLATILGLPVNPLHPVDFEVGPFFADVDLLNVFVNAGLNFLQEFDMTMGDLTGVLMFEDGSNSLFTIGDSLQISDASLIDLGGDDDGLVEFDFTVVPTSTLDNLTELGFNIGGGVDLLSVSVGYDGLTIPNPFGDDVVIAGDSVGFGPLAGFELSFPVAEIEVFNDTFDLAFETEQFDIFA